MNGTPGKEMMVMPAGIHSITAYKGKCPMLERPVLVTVDVTRESAGELEKQRAAIVARGERPYFDFEHRDGDVSFWPSQFYWKDAPDAGVYASGECTGAGRAGIEKKIWEYFSPVFHVDEPDARPARIVCNELAAANMGGLVNDPAFKRILPLAAQNAAGAQTGTANQTSQIHKHMTTKIEITEESLKASLDAFAAERNPRRRGAIYAKDISPRLEKGEDMPLSASNSPGTLAGTLVTQRSLELLKYTFPILSSVTSDFSEENAQYNQEIITRIIGVPAVQTYDPVEGWAASDATSTDVPVTLNQHKGVPITFDSNTLSSTVRRLFDEFAPAQSYALGLDMVNALYALIIAGNFTNAGTVATQADFDREIVIDMGTALQLRGVPVGPRNRTLLLSSSYFGQLAKDKAIVTLSAFQNPAIIEQGVLPDVHGFKVVDAPNLPATGNLTGFGFSKSALVIASRVPNDYTKAMPGASFGNMTVVTDADLGLSVMQAQYVNHDLGAATQRIALVYGVAKGQNNAGQLLTSQ